ncbi:MAG: aldo/keto reductase [Alphaproteobacteria bacterium]|nr:aldo/keto reductase [Alphaproteobacteria bacterium]
MEHAEGADQGRARAPGHREVGRTGLKISELGFGAGPLGNLYAPISDDAARHSLNAALDAGVTYVDTAPYYGFGLSERRVGDVLRGRQGIVLSTKVGRLLKPAPLVAGEAVRHGFCSAMPFEPVYDYGHDAILRSFEDSLQRLGLASIDLLYVHDIGAMTHGARAGEHFRALTRGGGLRALEELRHDRRIKGFGIGVNEIQACLDVMNEASLDAILLAGRYTLLEQTALDEMLPRCGKAGVSVIIGGPYNSGILATGVKAAGPVRYDYQEAPPEIVARVGRIEEFCARYNVPLAAAALHFPLAHPAVASVIPGMGSIAHLNRTLELYHAPIPREFWSDLRKEGLVRADAPMADQT